MCPKLAELTVIYPLPGRIKKTEHGPLSATAELAYTAIAEIVDACNALPNFDTLQIVHLFRDNSSLPSVLTGNWREVYSSYELKRYFKEEVEAVKDMAVGALGKGGERGKVIVRVIELGWDHRFKLAWLFRRTIRSVNIEEYKVG